MHEDPYCVSREAASRHRGGESRPAAPLKGFSMVRTRPSQLSKTAHSPYLSQEAWPTGRNSPPRGVGQCQSQLALTSSLQRLSARALAPRKGRNKNTIGRDEVAWRPRWTALPTPTLCAFHGLRVSNWNRPAMGSAARSRWPLQRAGFTLGGETNRHALRPDQTKDSRMKISSWRFSSLSFRCCATSRRLPYLFLIERQIPRRRHGPASPTASHPRRTL